MLTPNTQAQHLSADGAVQTFNFIADQYLSDVYFHFAPTAGTSAGLHQYDTQLEDYSAANIQKQIAALHTYEKKIVAIDPSALDASIAADHTILLNNIRSQLLTLEVIRPWEKNPDIYSSGATNAAYVIMERPYASTNARLKSLVEREKLMPQLLLDARKNLKNPPKIYTEIALEQIDGLIRFFQTDVPAAFLSGPDAATDSDTKAAFAKSNAALIEALKSYGAWMKSDLLPRSSGDYKFGADTFAKKLRYDEMVDISLDRLLEIAFADLHKNQAEFARVAKEVDPTKTPQEVLAELATIHPAPDKLLTAFQDTFASLITFIDTHHIITIPSKVEPTLEETPPFMRATTQASMDPPGAFETHSTKAYFNVTLPEKTWTAPHVAEHMAAFNAGTIISTSVHEAYPGHYTQFLWQPQFPSKIRQVLGANTNIEGWAHYTEQMMLDQGYAAAPPDATPAQIRQGKVNPPRSAPGRAPPRRPFRQLHQAPHRPVHLRPGRRFLRLRRLPVPLRRPRRNQTRHRRRHLPLLHPRQARNHEAPRRYDEEARPRLQPPAVPRQLYAPGIRPHQSHPQSHAPRRLTRALITTCSRPASHLYKIFTRDALR